MSGTHSRTDGPADGDTGVRHRAVAPQGELRSGRLRHVGEARSPLEPLAIDGDIVVVRLGVELGRGKRAL